VKKLTKTLCVTAIAGAVAIPFTAAQAWGPSGGGPWSNGWGHDGYGYGGYPGAYVAPYGYAPPAATPAQPAASGAGQ
jgi:hypothetical protein